MKPPAFYHYLFVFPRQLYRWRNLEGDTPTIKQYQGHVESYQSEHNKKRDNLIQACCNIRDHSREYHRRCPRGWCDFVDYLIEKNDLFCFSI